MRLRQRSLLNGLILLGVASLLGAGCSEDGDDGVAPAGGKSAGGKSAGGSSTSSAGKGGKDGGEAEGGGGASTSNGGAGGEGDEPLGGAGEAGAAGAGSPGAVTFAVPAGGGDVEVVTPSGNAVAFQFPASAAGLTVVLTPDTSSSVGYDDGRFVDVIRMEPDGTTFDEPVEVRTQNRDLLLFEYASGTGKRPAEGLPLSAAGDALLLSHFSTLVVVPPEYSCDSQSGWVATPNSGECTAFGANSTYVEFTCKAFQYCLLINAHCCAPAGSTECRIGMPALRLSYQPRDSNGGQYPHCDAPSGGGEGGAGGVGSGGTSGSGGTGGAGGSGGTGGGSNLPGASTVLGDTSEVTALRVDGSNLYYSAIGAIARVPVAGGDVTPIASSADWSGRFDVDATNVYFSYGGALYAHAKDGSGSDIDLAVTGAVFFNAYVEESGGDLYVASGLNVFRAPVAGNTAAVTLVSNEPGPTSLTVSGNDLYFVTGSGTGTHQKAVMKVPTAGGNVTPLVENLAANPAALAVSGGYVYYVTGSALERISTAGGTPEPVAAAGGNYLAVDGSDVYFIGSTLNHVATTGQVVAPLTAALVNGRIALDSGYVYYSTMSGPAPAPGIFRIAR